MEPSHTANQLGQTSSRLPAVDMLRGFALLGIGIENIFAIHSPNEVFAQYAAQYPDGVSHWILMGLMVLVRGKFYPIFSLVFGIAFAFSLATYGPSYFIRRLGVFFVLGLLQVLFVWTGDVLIQYAVMGLVLVLLRNLSYKVLLAISVFLLFFSFISVGFMPVSTANVIAPEFYQTGTFWQITKMRVADYIQSVASWVALSFYAKIFAFMLFGYVLAKSGFLQKLTHGPMAIKSFIGHSSLVLLIVAMFLLTGWRDQDDSAGNWLKSIFLAIYFYGFVACYSLLPFLLTNVFSPFKILGQFTLTHYLLQNLIFSLLMYGYGFGLMGAMSPVQLVSIYMVLITILWFATLVWSHWFKLGPMEYVLRRLAGQKA